MKINENSTKALYLEIYCNNKLLSTATGFEVQHNYKYLITNWHIVSGKNFITKEYLNSYAAIPDEIIVKYKKFLKNDNYEWVKESIKLYDENKNPKWIEHPKYGNSVDVVAIPFENEYSQNQVYDCRECLNFRTIYNVTVTDKLFILGFPFGYTVNGNDEPHAIWTSGSVASDPDLCLIIDKHKMPAFLIDSKTREGQSGSPVIYYSKDGYDSHYGNGFACWGSPFMKEVGIYTGRINKESDLGYVWKWSVIKEILEQEK